MPLPENPLPKEHSLAKKIIQDSFQSFGKIEAITFPVIKAGNTVFIDFEPTEDLKARWEPLKRQKVSGVDGHEFEVSPAKVKQSKPSVRVYVGMPNGNSESMPKSHVEAALAEFGKIARIETRAGGRKNVIVEFERLEDAAKAIEGNISLPDGTVLSPSYAHPPRSPTKIMEFWLSGPLRASGDRASIEKRLFDSLALVEDHKPEKMKFKLPLDPEKPVRIRMKFKSGKVSRKVMEAVESLDTVEFTCTARYVVDGWR